MNNKRPDYLRILAVLTIFFGIIYFYADLLAPNLIPRFLRLGSFRRPVTILLLGTDYNFSLENGRLVESEGRTDSLMLMRIDPIRDKITLFSIPRDSFVEIPGYGYNKINAANVFGGTALVKRTVAGLTGAPIDYFIKINPSALTKMVDLIGGININVDKDMYYVDHAQNLYINLKAGRHKLNGVEAQAYLRFRHDATGDIGRMGRQQKFLETLFLNFARPANLLKAPVAVGIARQNIQTDLPLAKLIRLANFARLVARSDVITLTTTGEPSTSSYAGDILIPNKNEIRGIIKAYF